MINIVRRMIIFSFLTALSCTNDPIVHDPESLGLYDLRCKIAPSNSQLGAILEFINPENMPIDTHGATVTISGEEQLVTLSEIKPGFYTSGEALLEIKPGGQYGLSATCPDGSVLNGKTFVPGPFRIVKNSPNDTLEYIVKTFSKQPWRQDNIPPKIFWTRSQHALSYTLLIRGQKSSVDTTVFLPEQNITKYFQQHPDETNFVETIEINITAYDSSRLPYRNSYGYYHENWRDPYGENISIDEIGQQLNLVPGQNDNIIGGTGYFASSYTITDSAIIRYKKELEIE